MKVIVEGIQFTKQTSHKPGRNCSSDECGRSEIQVGSVYYRVAKADAVVAKNERGRGSSRKISGPRAQEQGLVSSSEKVELFHEQCFVQEFTDPEA